MALGTGLSQGSRDTLVARDVVNKAVGKFGVTAVSERLGRSVEEIRFWQCLPVGAVSDMPPFGDLRALVVWCDYEDEGRGDGEG